MSLTACGGGGGNDDPQPQPDTSQSTTPKLVSVESVGTEQIEAYWLGSLDDSTAVTDIRYELHVGDEENFSANAGTLNATYTGELQGRATGLLPNTAYYIQVTAIDSAGNQTTSTALAARTASAETAQTSVPVKQPADVGVGPRTAQ